MNYLSLTIGPIYETMSYCKKTRELWVGSYFFSLFMRRLITKLKKEIEDINFIIPYLDEEGNILSKYEEAGVFHDRFIATSSNSKEDIKIAIEESITKVIKEFENGLFNNVTKNLKNSNQIKLTDAIKNYLQYDYVIGNEDEILKNVQKENVVFAIDAILDTLELQNSFDFNNGTKIYKVKKKDYKNQPEEIVNPVALLQYQAYQVKNITDNKKLNFKSIPEIALANLLDKDIISPELKKKLKNLDDNYDDNSYGEFYDELYKILKEHEKESNFKQHHKYFAIIYADGDKMGGTIRKIYSSNDKDNNIKQFSKNIYTYITQDETLTEKQNKSLYELIDDFGGMLIFAGGDDMLAFAPIFGKNNKTIFDLLEELSSRFKKEMSKNLESIDVSLSFGLSINYYKYPMIEAINKANKLLYKAKSHNSKEKSGSVAISLIKHSGQSFECEFFVGDNLYNKYKKIFTDELQENIQLPHNLQYSLKRFEALIIDIFKNYSKCSNNKLDALFENLIKDDSHSSEAKEALDELKEYIKAFKPNSKESFNKLITQLAIIKFLRGDN